LEAFLRVAKLGSAKAAASELALSPPALSRRIKALEDFIGKSLFDRRAQAMVINADGETLLAAVEPAMDAMAEAVEELAAVAVNIACALACFRFSVHSALSRASPNCAKRSRNCISTLIPLAMRKICWAM